MSELKIQIMKTVFASHAFIVTACAYTVAVSYFPVTDIAIPQDEKATVSKP